MNEGTWAFIRTLVFFALVPGSLTTLVPLWLLRGIDTSGGLPLLGAPLILLGAALLLWSGFGFSFIGRGTPNPVDEPNELVVWGPYRWVRNPMYVGVLTIIVGEAIAFSLALLIYAAVLWAFFHTVVVLYEEPHLTERFGESYVAYRRRVWRWIPRRPRADAIEARE